ncbi:hypothetical protein GOBAR_AA17049 [Gossypium barbadense]|uniref:Uncharacterized protein n=1 Tax=Gossypium barbadense TaxID=3634 RepID=A0A2P5XJW0_GOSBA|nr:hypothetical protein GOBAR_AA17049 [Gossypium barbadense]
MSLIDPNAAHVVEFLEYPEILLAHQLAEDSDPEELFVGQRFESKKDCSRWEQECALIAFAIVDKENIESWEYFLTNLRRSIYYIWHIATNFHQDYKNVDWRRKVVRMVHELEPYIFRQRMTRLESDMEGLKPTHLSDSGWMVLLWRFQTLHYACAHVVVACAKVSLNVEQFVDDVYTLECTLRVWENEFPVLLDLSAWEVPSTTFKLVADKRLHKNSKGRL